MTAEIVEFNPFKLAGTTLKERIDVLEIKDFNDVETAKDVLKECTDLEKKIEDVRTSITKPVNDMLKNINNMAKEVSLPVNEAKINVKKKIVDFNEWQEKLKKQEDDRIAKVILNIKGYNNSLFLQDYIDTLSELDQNNFVIKTAIFDQKMKIEEENRRKEEEQKRKEEQEKLDEEKKKMSEEQAKLAEEKMKLEQEKRDLEEQKRKDAQEKELEAKNKIVEQIKNTETDKVKGMRTNIKWEVVSEGAVPCVLCSPDTKKINDYLKKNPGVLVPGLKIWEEKTVQ